MTYKHASIILVILEILFLISIGARALANGQDKIIICHIPPGNEGNPVTIEIAIPAAVAAGHFVLDEDGNPVFPGGHGGDYLGPCRVETTPTATIEPTSTTIPPTSTVEPTATTAIVPTNTVEPTVAATSTTEPSPTNTPIIPTPDLTATPVPTIIATVTPVPTSTPTEEVSEPTPSPTSTVQPTATPTGNPGTTVPNTPTPTTVPTATPSEHPVDEVHPTAVPTSPTEIITVETQQSPQETGDDTRALPNGLPVMGGGGTSR